MIHQKRVVGILGGKGPEATNDLFRLIIRNTQTQVEEDHLHIIIDNNPQIPKPALGITGEGENPVPELVRTAKNLEKAGAKFIVIPCNSAHYYLNEIKNKITIPIVSIITETVKSINKQSCKRIGLFATTGTIESKLYQSEFEESDIEVIIPEKSEQSELMEQVLYFKDTGDKTKLVNAVKKISEKFISQNIDGLVFGCTDIAVVLGDLNFMITCFNTIEILADAAIREAYYSNQK